MQQALNLTQSIIHPEHQHQVVKQYLKHHGGVGRGQLVYDLAVAVLHHGLVLARIHHHLLATAAFLRGRPTAHLALPTAKSLPLHVAQQRGQRRWQLVT